MPNGSCYDKAKAILKRNARGPKITQDLQKKFNKIEDKIHSYVLNNPDVLNGRSEDDISLITDVIKNIRDTELQTIKSYQTADLEGKSQHEKEIEDYKKQREQERVQLTLSLSMENADEKKTKQDLDRFDKETNQTVEEKEGDLEYFVRQRGKRIKQSADEFKKDATDYDAYIKMKRYSTQPERSFVKARENLSHVLDMRKKAEDAYQKTSLLSRIARWILPNSWSEAGRIQDQIDEYNKAITDSGFTLQQADKMCATELTYGDALSKENLSSLKNIVKDINELDSEDLMRNPSIRNAVNTLNRIVRNKGELYDEEYNNLIDKAVNECKVALKEIKNEDNLIRYDELFTSFKNMAGEFSELVDKIKDEVAVEKQPKVFKDKFFMGDDYETSLDNLQQDIDALKTTDLSLQQDDKTEEKEIDLKI